MIVPLRIDEWLQDSGFSENLRHGKNRSGLTPLMEAARQGNHEAVRHLLAHGADVLAINDDGNNALWLACHAGNLEIIHLLIDAGISLNHQNLTGATCLMFAASTGKHEVVSVLMARGAEQALRTYDDFSALDLASTEACLNLLRPPKRSRI